LEYKTKLKRTLGKPRYRLEDNIKKISRIELRGWLV
jgi:hypothetical protein